MPTYEYRCKSCSHEFEHFQSMKDAPLRKCPECGKNTLERLIGTGAAVIFKGSGFYQTDYRNEAYKKAAEADKPKSESTSSDKAADTKSSDTSKPESKSDSKTESKSETKSEKTSADTSSKSRSAPKPSTAKSKSTKKSTK